MPGPTITIEDLADTAHRPEWAVGLLAGELRSRGVDVAPGAERPDLRILVCAPDTPAAGEVVARWERRHGGRLVDTPEAFAVGPPGGDPDATIAVAGADERGLGHALLELYDVVRYADDVLAGLRGLREYLERPHNAVRSVTRIFSTAATDTAWLHDRSFWTEYLTELAVHRFNRFSLGLGAGYDYLIDRRVTDNYLCFPYPFLLDVDGYDVRAAGVDAGERERNLATLQFVGAEATRRGIDFGLGLWNHAYRYDPDAETERWPIIGLDAGNHAAYARDALAALLTACPDVRRLTFRVHFEGGVPEPTHEFWRIVLSGLTRIDRVVELDMHAKGVSDELVQIAADLGVPLTLSTKHWGEHQGLPYHQASIREKERIGRAGRRADGDAAWHPGTGHPGRKVGGTQTTSQRSFTRYGYGDYARRTRPYDLLHRVWPGTQRVLLWGDPVLAAAYGRHADFAGAAGMEWFEPLSFLGKKDSAAVGSPGGQRRDRRLYRDPALQEVGDDWRKFRYTYRLLGRTGYAPDTPEDDLTRPLPAWFGAAGPAVGRALGSASRILPLITAAHAPSTACNVYWPEISTPVPIVARTEPVPNPFPQSGWPASADFDMFPPYTFGNVSPLDPELFYGVDEFAADVEAGRRRGKHTPIEVAEWLDGLADAALTALAEARSAAAAGVRGHDLLRLVATDVEIQAGLGRSFAATLRAGVACALRSHTHAATELRQALQAWDDVVRAAEPYVDDLPFGQTDYSRGSWRDRRGLLAADLAAVEALCAASGGAHSIEPGAMPDLSALAPGPAPRGEHRVSSCAAPGVAVRIEWRPADPEAGVRGVRLRFRPVNQANAYETIDMEWDGDRFRAWIPATATSGPFPLQYYFELIGQDEAWPYPGLAADLANQPYYVLHADAATSWGRHDI